MGTGAGTANLDPGLRQFTRLRVVNLSHASAADPVLMWERFRCTPVQPKPLRSTGSEAALRQSVGFRGREAEAAVYRQQPIEVGGGSLSCRGRQVDEQVSAQDQIVG